MNDYNDYINSEIWKGKKTERILQKGKSCEKCGKELDRKGLNLHHKNYDKEFGLEDENDLMLVCENCHNELHQDIEFFDNEEMKKRCQECNKPLINNKCKFCGIEVENA